MTGVGASGGPRDEATLLSARDLTREFPQPDRTIVALSGVSLDVEPGECVIVTGESGSGKSTLLALLGLIDRPTRGRVAFRGEALESASSSRLARVRREHVGFVFQDFRLVPHLSALDNVRLPLDHTGRSRDSRRAASELLARFGLGDRASHRPDRLSRGEMQRVALARALVGRPSIVLADEPTANLDRRNAAEVWSILRHCGSEGIAVVVATHDRDRAGPTDLVLVLREGRLVSVESAPRRSRVP
jgi:putative ABC transport system ATP-binding protein